MSVIDQPIEYEYLIRSAYECGRHGAPGAHADTFRALERAYESYDNPRSTSKSKEQLYFEYAFKCGEVATYITDAINWALNKHEANFNERMKNDLEDCTIKLHNANIDTIIDVINQVKPMLNSAGLCKK